MKSEYFGRDLEAMSFAVNYHKWILREFVPYLGGNVAEVGAGSGDFSLLLSNTQANAVIAFEPSTNMYPLLAGRLENKASVKPVNAFFSEEYIRYKGYFDSIVYVNVLEHIEDDKRELSCAHTALKRNGHVLVFVPALPCLFSEFDEKIGHFRRYLKKDIVSRLEASGFEIVEAKYFDLVGILPWYLAFVLLHGTLTSDSVRLYDKFVVPVMNKVERFFPPPVGKNLLMVARRS